MKKSKQKSKKLKRYIRKQLKKAKEDIANTPFLIKIADTSTHLSAPNSHHGYHGNYPYHAHAHAHVHSHSIGHYSHNPHHHSAGVHLHSPHEIPRHNHCHGSDSIKVFDKEDSEVRVEEKM